mgnify:CR=1 FL=1
MHFLSMTRFSMFMGMKPNWNIVFPNFMKRCIVNYMSFIGMNLSEQLLPRCTCGA